MDLLLHHVEQDVGILLHQIDDGAGSAGAPRHQVVEFLDGVRLVHVHVAVVLPEFVKDAVVYHLKL